MERLREQGAAAVVVTRAADPALALLEGRAWELVGPRFEARDPSGAGDSMFAAIAVGIAAGADVGDALRLGVAAGALNVTRRGLGSGDRSEIERLLPRVAVRELTDQPAP
jgi:1-phosphofructokinase